MAAAVCWSASTDQDLTLAEVPLQYAGSSGGILQTGQRVGTSVGIAVITSATFTVLGATGGTRTVPVESLERGDVLRLVVTVQNVRGSVSKPDRGYVVVQMETLIQNDEVVQRGKARMLAFKKPTA